MSMVTLAEIRDEFYEDMPLPEARAVEHSLGRGALFRVVYIAEFIDRDEYGIRQADSILYSGVTLAERALRWRIVARADQALPDFPEDGRLVLSGHDLSGDQFLPETFQLSEINE